MANGQNGNGVSFRWVAVGLATVAIALAGGWAHRIEGTVHAVGVTATVNKTDIAVVKEVVSRIEAKVDRLLDNG